MVAIRGEGVKLFSYDGGNNGISFYRVWQLTKALRKLGVHVDGLDGKYDLTMAQHQRIVEDYDVISTTTSSAWYNAARICGMAKLKPMIVDMDDDVVGITTDNPNYDGWMPQPDQYQEYDPATFTPSKIEEIRANGGDIVLRGDKPFVVLPGNRPIDNVLDEIRAAAVFTTTTKYLAEVYKPYAKRIEIVPNGVDFELWHGQANDTDKFRIGLFGSNTHIRDWREAIDSIKRFLSEHDDAVLVSNCFLKLPEGHTGTFYGAKATAIVPEYMDDLVKSGRCEMWGPCEIQDYPKWLADKKADVILAPLRESRFNRSKSNIKWLEATALGVPVIASKLEPYEDIEHGRTGLLADKPIDFYRHLKRLYSDKQERKQMAANALEVVKSKYDMTKIAARYAEILNSLEVTKCAA